MAKRGHSRKAWSCGKGGHPRLKSSFRRKHCKDGRIVQH